MKNQRVIEMTDINNTSCEDYTECGTGHDMFSGERVLMTVSQQW